MSGEYVSRVDYGSQTLIDLTADTVTVNVMLAGYTAHDASGAPITGTVADGNDLAYGTSSYLVGTAKVGTGYAWTEIENPMVMGAGIIGTSVVI